MALLEAGLFLLPCRRSSLICFRTFGSPDFSCRRAVDLDEISLSVEDVDDPDISIEKTELSKRNKDRLISWIKYRGGSLKGLHTVRECRWRVLHYMENGLEKKICDPSPDKKWLRRKADKLALIIKPTTLSQPSMLLKPPNVIANELGAMKSLAGWTKSLSGAPILTMKEIKAYFDHVSTVVMKNATIVKKSFNRGSQLIEENFLDKNTVYAKHDEIVFCLKGFCGASLRKKGYWITVAMNRKTSEIVFACCQCEAGKGGTCSHSFALMKTFAKWSLDQLKEIPEDISCTSKPCVWSVPQLTFRAPSSKKRQYHSINESDSDVDGSIEMPAKRQKVRSGASSGDTSDERDTNKPKGIRSTLYEARSPSVRGFDIESTRILLSKLEIENPAIPMCAMLQSGPVSGFADSKFGSVPVGSILSFHRPLLRPGFKVYSSIPEPADNVVPQVQFINYPNFPVKSVKSMILEHITKVIEPDQISLLEELKVTKNEANDIEYKTREQLHSKEWFAERKFRFTASLTNKISEYKTERGLASFSKKLFESKSKKSQNNVIKFKLEHGVFFEPKAVSDYELFMSNSGRPVTVEKSGLVISTDNYIFGASPDGKVIDVAERNDIFGLLEIKCPEEYKECDPTDICWVSPNPCIIKELDSYRINRSHSYFSQVQMAMALTGTNWCDFVVYTFKGLVIDRVYFDQHYWDTISRNLDGFYFKHFLPAAVNYRSRNTDDSTKDASSAV